MEFRALAFGLLVTAAGACRADLIEKTVQINCEPEEGQLSITGEVGLLPEEFMEAGNRKKQIESVVRGSAGFSSLKHSAGTVECGNGAKVEFLMPANDSGGLCGADETVRLLVTNAHGVSRRFPNFLDSCYAPNTQLYEVRLLEHGEWELCTRKFGYGQREQSAGTCSVQP